MWGFSIVLSIFIVNILELYPGPNVLSNIIPYRYLSDSETNLPQHCLSLLGLFSLDLGSM